MAAKFGLLIDAKTKGENNIKRLGNSMQGVEGKAKNLGMAVRGVGNAFKALFAAAAVAGFSAFVKGAIDSADAFGKLSTRTGIAADKLQAFANAGKLADVSQSDLENGLRAFARTQAEAADGLATYADAYKKLGIGVTQADGSLKASDQLLGEIADKFADLPNGPEKAAIAMDIFGRSGSKLITLLNGGSEALERFNYETSENFAQNAELFNDKITTLQIQFDGFRMQLADALLPTLNSIIEAFSVMLSAERDFTGFFTAIDVSLKALAVSLAATAMAITEIVQLVKTAATALGAISLGRFGEAIDAFKDFGAGVSGRFGLNKEIIDLILGRIQAPTNYGGGGRDLRPVTIQTQTPADTETPEEKQNKVTEAVKKTTAATLKLGDATDKYKITLDQVKDTLANQMTNAIEGLISGTQSLSQSLSGLLKTFASMFLRSGIGSLFSFLPFAKGGVFAQNKIVPFAYGGVVNKPTLFPMANGAGLMGEAGPEAIMPLRRGRGGRLGVEASGASNNIVVNVDASGTQAQGDQPNAKALGSAIGAAVQAELIKQRRPGGLLAN